MHQTSVERARQRVGQLREELKGEVQAEVHGDLRRARIKRWAVRACGCCSVYAAVAFAVPVVLGYLVARTGLVSIPIVGDRIRHERAPTRLVSIVRVDSARFAASVARPPVRAGTATPRLTVTEGELTGLLRTALADVAPPLLRSSAQVAVLADTVEVYGRIPGIGGAVTSVRLRGVPSVQDGALAVDLRELAIGNLGIPRPLARLAVRSLLDRMAPLRIPVGPTASASVAGMELRDGMVTITLGSLRP